MLSDIMRYASMGNLTGLPSLSVPAGFTPDKLPMGLQIRIIFFSAGKCSAGKDITVVLLILFIL